MKSDSQNSFTKLQDRNYRPLMEEISATLSEHLEDQEPKAALNKLLFVYDLLLIFMKLYEVFHIMFHQSVLTLTNLQLHNHN
jgi:hypothetical protein